MATTALSLPIDVPWKRLAISQDMYAVSIDAAFPEKWRSSLAVYYYEPEPDPNDNTGEVTTFLKLVSSITGYNYDLYLPFLHQGHVEWVLLETYYPALCAVAQVAVFPSDGQQDLSLYPYFSDFNPKQREVIETKTDTGEVVTHTTDPLKVTKSTTALESQAVGYGSITTTAKTDVATETLFTDASRERRETTSFSTNLAQLYELLDTYHTGTNRALFLTVARPHLVDSIYTFVNGPRRLEGIQDFFLVVRRPKQMSGICVKAQLETAHLDLGDTSGDPATLFTTARAVSGCTVQGGAHILPAGPWVVYERQLPQSVNDLVNASQQSGQAAVVAANALSRQVRDLVVASFRDGLRYPLGQVDLLHTNLVMRKILARLSNQMLEERPEVLSAAKNVEASLRTSSPKLSSRELAVRSQLLQALGLHTKE